MAKYATTQATGLQDITPGKLYGVHASGPVGFCFHDDKGSMRSFDWGQHGFSVHPQPDAKGKTLKELDVKPGDVVQFIGDKDFPEDSPFTIQGWSDGDCYDTTQELGDGMDMLRDDAVFRLISRASDTTEALEELAELDSEEIAGPKTFGEMSDAEKGALLLSKLNGVDVQYSSLNKSAGHPGGWQDQGGRWFFVDDTYYRIKPESVVREVALTGKVAQKWIFTDTEAYDTDTYRITFTTTDGKPDLDSIKMEEIEESNT